LKRRVREESNENKRKEELLKRIDPSVDLVSNDIFNLSLNEIKAELSEKIRNKEAVMQKELKRI
jgi:hypothetical protein